MAKKGVAPKIRLESTGVTKEGKPTGTRRWTKKGKNYPEKIQRRAYDPRAWNEEKGHPGAHVLFVEKKMPPHKKN
jgi:large subunit ribosomal protein L33